MNNAKKVVIKLALKLIDPSRLYGQNRDKHEKSTRKWLINYVINKSDTKNQCRNYLELLEFRVISKMPSKI